MVLDQEHKFSVAPMMDWTDRHCRVFHRMLSKRARLFTEMITAGAILHGDRHRLLDFSPAEHPLALQVGGSEPQTMADVAEIGESWGYDEVNINVGCPSDRVQSGRFGACLMAEPTLVARCVEAMVGRVSIPVTVKTRIGIDDMDEGEPLRRFVSTVASAGCRVFTIHARKAWLSGLSPKQNRTVPPLNHARVYELKREFPDLTIVLNGGVDSLDAAAAHLEAVDGVMIGRAAYQTPYLLADVDRRHFGGEAGPDRDTVAERMIPYIEEQCERGVPLAAIARHMLGLYHAEPGGRLWRRVLTEQGVRAGAGAEVVVRALEAVRHIRRQDRPIDAVNAA